MEAQSLGSNFADAGQLLLCSLHVLPCRLIKRRLRSQQVEQIRDRGKRIVDLVGDA